MSALKAALKSPQTLKTSSSKNPAYYSREKTLFINEMASHIDPSIRISVASNQHVPTGTLKQMLENDSDNDVLRVVLLNIRTPWKAIAKFTEDVRAKAFDDDAEIISYLKARAGSSGAENEVVE
jgi:hypothetical protein